MKVSNLSFGASSLGGVFHGVREDEGIRACVIGKFTSMEEGFVRIDKATGERMELTPPEADELYGM